VHGHAGPERNVRSRPEPGLPHLLSKLTAARESENRLARGTQKWGLSQLVGRRTRSAEMASEIAWDTILSRGDVANLAHLGLDQPTHLLGGVGHRCHGSTWANGDCFPLHWDAQLV